MVDYLWNILYKFLALLSWGNKNPDNKYDACFSYQQACIKK